MKCSDHTSLVYAFLLLCSIMLALFTFSFVNVLLPKDKGLISERQILAPMIMARCFDRLWMYHPLGSSEVDFLCILNIKYQQLYLPVYASYGHHAR